MMPILRSSSVFFALYSSTSLITEAICSTSCWAAATSASLASFFGALHPPGAGHGEHADQHADRQHPLPDVLAARAAQPAFALRTAAGRLPSESRLILIIG